MLALPMLIYLKHQRYPLAQPEILVIFAGIAVVGLLLGLAMLLGRSPGLVIGTSALLIYVLDIQTSWLDRSAWLLPVVCVLAAGFCWLMRKHLSRMLFLISAAMFVSTLVLPGGHPVIREGRFEAAAPGLTDLPLVLHLILDEQTGIEGIPREFDPDRAIADQMKDFYLENDFQVFGRAYSRYWQTRDSVSNLLNFASNDTSVVFFGGRFEEGQLLRENAWFDRLHEQGFSIHVVQSDYMLYHRGSDSDAASGSDTGVTFTSQAIRPLIRTTLSTREKIPFIVGTYIELSEYLKRLDRLYRKIRTSRFGAVLHLPYFGGLDVTRVSPLAAMDAMAELKSLLNQAQPGQAILGHVLLPHHPYALDPDCGLEPRVERWLEFKESAAHPQRNTRESRAVRYPLYLDQLLCTQALLGELFGILMARGLWDSAIVVVHGDHGSRIDMGSSSSHFVAHLNPSDFLDGHSTLFAVKRPGVPGSYDRRQLPIDHLFRRLLVDEIPPGDPELENNPFVLIRGQGFDGTTLVRQPMPGFDHGQAH